MMRLHRLGQWLLVIGVATFVLYAGVTWAVSPDPLSDDATYTPEQTTLFGAGNAYSQGGAYELAVNGSVVWSLQQANYYNDVERLNATHVRATFTVTEQDCGPYAAPCGRTGVQIINQTSKRVVWEYSYLTRTRIYSEVHDVELLPGRDELLIVGMDRERVFIVNRSTRNVVWQWNASQRYDAPADPTRADWLHMNDVDRIAPGQYLVSVRNANEIVVLNRSCECVVDVINEGGDAGVIQHQHNPQWLGSGAVLVADSKNDRVVELHEQPNGTWTVAWALYGANGVRFDWPRDADRLPNGHTLVTDTRNDRLVEVTRSGEVMWAVQAPPQGYDADRGAAEYPAGQPYDARAVTPPFEQPFATVAYIYAGARHYTPLPFWISEWHVLVFIVSIGVSAWGLAFVLISRVRALAQQHRPEVQQA